MHRPTYLPGWNGAAELTGRRGECVVLDDLVRAVRSGDSRALVLHGEAGVGKTALVDRLVVRTQGCRVARAAGIQSEMELPFAGLHQLCAPMLDQLDRLPAPQRDALRTIFGLSAAPAPDRFMVGLAVLGLLSAVAEQRPLLCLVDDQQWLDRASTQVLAFVARRLGAESVGLVFAARTVHSELAALPALEVGALPDADARALLDAALAGPLDARVRDQIVAEARGNPLALLELPRGITPAELAGGFGLPGAGVGGMEEQFQRRVAALPEPTRRFLLLMAADPTGDPAVLARAAANRGIDSGSAVPAADAGLADFGARARFRHPLVRSAVYRSAPANERRAAHRALADATDARREPDRRAWHRAAATARPDEDVAAELDRSADRARARGGLAAAAAFLQRAASLTPDPAQRAGRALAAAEAEVRTGGFDAALELLDVAADGPLTDGQQARTDLVHAQLAFVANRGNDAPVLLVQAAQRLARVDPALSRATYLDALSAAIFAGRRAAPGGTVRDVARAARAAPPAPDPGVADLLIDGTVAAYTDGYAAGLPALREAMRDLGTGRSAAELDVLWMASTTALRIADDERWDVLSARHLELARERGALSELPLALTNRAYLLLFTGDLAGAASLTAEAMAVTEATGSNLAPYSALGLAAFRGDGPAAVALVDATRTDVTRRGEGIGITFAEWASALVHNGLGDYPTALEAAGRATAYQADQGAGIWALVELIEAATRCDAAPTVADAFDRLAEMMTASGTDWALGIQARSQALLTGGDAADGHYRTAIVHLERTRLRVDLARAHLLYGEWLRRERRPTDAREQLRRAHDMFDAMGTAAFAERAARELRAAGGNSNPRVPAPQGELTVQEAQIARMAADGLSNPEIATRLFISARTVQYHLRKVFTKLGITSRSQLDRVLPAG
ncbi:AAA family ATPase [Asanoa sp. NPDC049573]|uniref:AAA family ATPase n=1 Tax=Asanoa sp. NPDC049573 TaxID=3155396 RepID=UPI00341DC9ED